MASETMESAIAMEVASIRRAFEENLESLDVELSHRDVETLKGFVLPRLANISKTLQEGDPG